MLTWSVDNSASIWVNGHQLVDNGGSWSSLFQMTVPAAYLNSGTNTIAAKIGQDAAANNWTANPTFVQVELVVPTK